MPAKKFTVEGCCHNCSDADYNLTVNKINHLKVKKGTLLSIIESELCPKKEMGSYFVPLVVKLCLCLWVLAGGSYLDHLLDMVHHLHCYACQAIHVLDSCTDPFLDNFRSSIHATPEELQELEHGFAQLSDFQL